MSRRWMRKANRGREVVGVLYHPRQGVVKGEKGRVAVHSGNTLEGKTMLPH